MVTYLAALSWTISIMFTSVSPNRNGSTDESCEIHVTNRQRNTSSFGDMLQHLKRHSLEDQLRAACLVMKYIIYHDKVAVSRSDRLSPPMRHSRNVHSQPYQVSLCKTQQRKTSFFPHSIVDWNRIPQTAVLSDSVESFRPDCDYFI